MLVGKVGGFLPSRTLHTSDQADSWRTATGKAQSRRFDKAGRREREPDGLYTILCTTVAAKGR